MNPLLEQFLSEAHEFAQGIGAKLLRLEAVPDDRAAIDELFRLVHTLKGNSGLFTFPTMTQLLHAAEDLLGLVRNGSMRFSDQLADPLLEALDLVQFMCADIEKTGEISAARAPEALQLSERLRALAGKNSEDHVASTDPAQSKAEQATVPPLELVPEPVRASAFEMAVQGQALCWVDYRPHAECFFQGDDPFFRVRQTPGLLWGGAYTHEALGELCSLDTYRCVLGFRMLLAVSVDDLHDHYRYVLDQVTLTPVEPCWLAAPVGSNEADSEQTAWITAARQWLQVGNLEALRLDAETRCNDLPLLSRLASALRWLVRLFDAPSATVPAHAQIAEQMIQSIEHGHAPDWASPAEEREALSVVSEVLETQRRILQLDDKPAWLDGRRAAVAAVLRNIALGAGMLEAPAQIDEAFERARSAGDAQPLLDWIDTHRSRLVATPKPEVTQATTEELVRSNRRADDAALVVNSLKVDTNKIDRLMNLIGELIVSKNTLPYLAQRAEDQYRVRELGREIKSQYAVLHRIAEEMQDSIMQVRMLAVSFVFQRFPRLVRDLSRKLGKEVELELEGEQTEADKNIIESLADPLIHIVRNSLDHGLETAEVRRSKGKPAVGHLTIRARQQGDRVLIEIVDDGKGINPAVIKQKALEKGVIDQAAFDRMDDREALQLIFAPGFSTAEVVSDLSGRGVGMDVVRTTVEKVHGTVTVESEVDRGTTIRITLPLSMAVTQVMVVESDKQLFGVTMENVIETDRVAMESIHWVKQQRTAVLRGRVVPLKTLNELLAIPAHPHPNADDELAVLLVRAGHGIVGLVVDGFRETVDVIQKPLVGVLTGLRAYSGSALLGDGSVLMILNLRELI